MNKKLARWYNVFSLDNITCIKNDDFIKKIIYNIEFTCNKSNCIITPFVFYNSLDDCNRNILHFIYINKLTDTYLFNYIISNKYAVDYYYDIYGKKPIDYL